MVKHTHDSLDDVRVRWRFLSASVKQDPNAAPYVAAVAAYATTWDGIDQKRKSLEDELADAQAAAIFNDRLLDGLADEIWTAIYGTKKVKTPSAVGKLFFGTANLSKFKRPVLGSELAGASAWPAHLAQATLPALLALAPKGAQIVAGAVAAATQLSSAISNLDQFTKGGDLQSAFDAFNAMSATVHAGLKAFSLAHPELKLGTAYADTFFMHAVRSPQPTTVAAAAELVAQLQHKLGVATKLQEDLVNKAKARTEAEALHDKAVAEAAAKKKAADEAKKEAAAAKKDAAKLKPKHK
jgi:hypothetical protein